MAAGYVSLPAFRAPTAIDWSPLGEAFDTIGEARRRNKLLADQRELGQTLAQPVQPSQPEPGANPYQAQPVNRLLSSPAQGSAAAAGRAMPVASPGDPNLPAGMRNNNPGNIKYIPGAKYAGLVGPSRNTDQGDPQMVFDTPQNGMKAAADLAMRKYQGGKRTAMDLIAGNMGWTPGNTSAAANIARTMGVQPNEDLRLDDPARMRAFMQALTLQEHGAASRRYGDDVYGVIGGQSQPSQAPAQTSRPSGLNYQAAIQKAAQQGNVALAMQLRNAQQEEEATAYNRQRQGTMDALSAESQGLTIQGKREELQQNAVKKIGAIAQVIQSQADPTKKAQMWQRFLSSDPSFASDLQAMGVDPTDVEAGTRMLVAQAGGLSESTRPIEVNGNLVQKQPDGSFKAVYTAPTKARNLSAAEQKEVFEADEGVQAGNNVVNSLTKALELNDKAYSGLAAGTRGYVGSIFGAEGGTATEDLTNLVTSQVLENLKATFGGAPTEGERQILLDVQGSVSKTPEVRKRVYERAIQAATRRIEFNKQKAGALRSGEYFQPGFTPASPSEAQVQQQAPASGPQVGAIEDGYRFKGGDASKPENWEKVN